MEALDSGTWDALVVGGGPAGASAAWHLAAGGARVALCERARPPRYKTCGGGLIPRALAELPPGFEPPVERALHVAELGFPREGLRFAVRDGARPIVSMTMRAELDHALLRAAEATGAAIFAERAFLGLERQGDALAVHTSGGPLCARLVIGADGALSAVARAAGLGDPPLAIPALEGELDVAPAALAAHSGSARFDLGVPSDGYAWVFPKRAHLSVGVLRMERGPVRLRALLAGYLRDEGLAGEPERHGLVIPVRPRPRVARGGVLLTGDAAGLADPVTGEGISLALRSGRLAAEACLAAGFEPARAERLYARRLRREVLAELAAGRFLARLVYPRPRVRRALFRRHGQQISEAVMRVAAGRTTYRRLLADPRGWLRLLLPSGAPAPESTGA